MSDIEKPLFPTFVCYTGNSLNSFAKVETTLYSDHIYFKGVYSDIEHSLSFSEIDKVIYRDWREKTGLLLFKTLIPFLSLISVGSYFMTFLQV